LLDRYQFLIIPGGFTYGDDLGAGTILANEISLKIFDALVSFTNKARLILGICNGFQVLVKCGLLPNPDNPHDRRVTLTYNLSNRFEDRWTYIKVCSDKSEYIKDGRIIELPVAHAEGRFVFGDDKIRRWVIEKNLIVLKYVDPRGDENAGYPWNPNGSDDNIAGICDPSGRILGLMPHPERFHDVTNHPCWTRFKKQKLSPHGMIFFQNAFNYVKERL
jgi:phosphoribosylformylglycinamidine synthase